MFVTCVLATMPRNYKAVTSGGHKKHDSEKFKKAVDDLEGGMSLRKSAEKHGIHPSVLYRHWKKVKTSNRKVDKLLSQLMKKVFL